jgi:hypothetical protein
MKTCPTLLRWTRVAAALSVVSIPTILEPGVSARADEYDLARQQHPALFQTYYDEGLLEYCGLLSREATRGFLLQRDDQLARQPLSDEQHRRVRVSASIAIDYQYDNHGLGGQRLWCNTAGLDAYNRFIDRYRAWTYTNGTP